MTASQFFLNKTSIFTFQGQTLIGLTRESLRKDVSRPLFQLKCYWSTATGIKVFQEDTFSQPVDVIVRSKVQFFHITKGQETLQEPC